MSSPALTVQRLDGWRRRANTPVSLALSTPGPRGQAISPGCAPAGQAPSKPVLGSSRPAAVRRDPSLPYLEQYRIDAPHQFRELFASLTPGPVAPTHLCWQGGCFGSWMKTRTR